MTEFTPGMLVRCCANGNMLYDFTGQITKLYEHSAIVEIHHFDARDLETARELLFRIVISLNQMVPAAIDMAVDEAVG
ncbi:hypothetical protein [Lacticaseibacillus sp. N501-2]|uniref:hypothetical protein n=1 Tax=Lacticaseibacillus salsurae TaxID=3367729 RepID=UPI0038B2BA88